ncbi:hypothetical protein TIFTF001_038063 [Ficus carica]|uniref:cellulase n=1 Tax=Ficus carica TaxID=3494 RepID=A0AA88E6K9_FICCA|nr:hypothetical protein TIFTF001_038063 [Ficus carica]
MLEEYRSKADHYLCACLNKNNMTNVRRTPGGLLYTRQWNSMQLVSNAVFLLTVFSDHLMATNRMALDCSIGHVGPQEIFSFAKSQIDYILGSNPTAVSYLVGYGQSYLKRSTIEEHLLNHTRGKGIYRVHAGI